MNGGFSATGEGVRLGVRIYSRCLHDHSDSARVDRLLHGDGDLPGEALLHLESSAECLCDARELGEAEDEFVRDVCDVNLRWEGVLSDVDKERTKFCRRRTFPVNGTKWCSQRDEISMSLTITISSWSSAKTASLITSARRSS